MAGIGEIGLSDQEINNIRLVFSTHTEIEKVILYGSRAKGNYRPNSDIDLTIVGEGVDTLQCFQIENELDDLLLPYTIDLSVFHQIDNPDLKDHIERCGRVFYVADRGE
ncbi:nucleotidyltransferase domain-containing protein [Persicobacter diffluens]|uniref:Polymerase beta nucleotidyltransferase domain-containing protein n=1 Tax=Persicobacter diffluens TaxID=981 RepID=A0AAN5AN07_9BACT|nr:hypothetical protein PEDI_55560 [Persicobacter diffluens]